jgi:hypothetical protein
MGDTVTIKLDDSYVSVGEVLLGMLMAAVAWIGYEIVRVVRDQRVAEQRWIEHIKKEYGRDDDSEQLR